MAKIKAETMTFCCITESDINNGKQMVRMGKKK